MKNRWIFTLMAILVVFSLVLTACGTAPVEEPGADDQDVEEPAAEESVADEPAAEESAEPKVVTVAWTQEPDTFADSLFQGFLLLVFLRFLFNLRLSAEKGRFLLLWLIQFQGERIT